METIKLIAVDLDGPLLVDTFSPIMYKLCAEYYAIEYTRELERNTFSRPRAEVVTYMKSQVQSKMVEQDSGKSDQEMMDGYFAYRAQFMKDNPSGIKPGVAEFLAFLTQLDVRLVCYGGLAEDYMLKELGELATVFDRYVCTNDFRPGVREITQDIYRLQPHQALFIDDVNFVAEHAKALGTPFIGIPSSEPWSWQKRDMIETGVTHIVESVQQIDLALLTQIDQEARAGKLWPRAHDLQPA